MADEQERQGIAPLETGTTQDFREQPPTPADATEAPQARKDPALENVEKELQRLRSEQGRVVAQARREAEQARQQAEQVRQQNRSLIMRDMSDVERVTYERDEAYAYARTRDAEIQEQSNLRQKQDDLQRIATLSGAPIDLLNEAKDFDDAWVKALTHVQSKTPAARQAESERSEANSVYVGGGAPSTPISRREQRFEEHKRNRDARAYVLDILNGD